MTLQFLFTAIFFITGGFAVLLGILHFTFPERFGFMVAIPPDGDPVPPFRLWFYKYDMKRTDLRGLIYVMNHCVSYTIALAGVFDLFSSQWLGTLGGKIGAIATAGFWFVRAATQLYLGRRKGDWFVFTFFSTLGLLHLAAAFV